MVLWTSIMLDWWLNGSNKRRIFVTWITFAPAARINSVGLLIAFVAIHDRIIHHMDVKTILLNGD